MTHDDCLHSFWRTMDNGGIHLLGGFLSEDYRRHSDEGTLSRDDFTRVLAGWYAAFPDLRTTIHDVLSDGGRAASRWTVAGTHCGPYLGIPPTGRVVRVGGLTISRFAADGRIAEDWTSWNRLSVL